MKNGLLKYAFFKGWPDKRGIFRENNHENSKNEAAASRIFIRESDIPIYVLNKDFFYGTKRIFCNI